MTFHFKQFRINDEHSTLRIGTDSMLLGAWADPLNARKILDIGTGCGVLALMMAQKSEATIEAIDIDPSSVNEARANFSNSPWSDRLTAIHTSLQASAGHSEGKFDFIITNPPFFDDSQRSSTIRRNSTRHHDHLTFEELLCCGSSLLTEDGTFALVLPALNYNTFLPVSKKYGLFLKRRMVVFPKPASRPKRMLMEFTRLEPTWVTGSELIILDGSGKFSSPYLVLTDRFHNFKPTRDLF